MPWRFVRKVDVLKISASGVEWIPNYEDAWAKRRGE
jgi:hypothetical protein